MEQAHVQLIQQGDNLITIPPGGIPVISYSDTTPSLLVAMAVNFLRSGCPAVQIISHHHTGEVIESHLKGVFEGVSLFGELFRFDSDERVFIVRRVTL
ncbi:MAG: hypothetical protein HY340_03020 [Candidatus Kerfeldbacteria bacterium]|nr:hypothetical protein [Candidatus Kerfeldbacteria bacterium]